MAMTTTAADLVSGYHQAWTAGNFDDAVALLAADLQVEVPINHYPTKDAFGRALRDFAQQVSSVEVLSQMATNDQAMMLYDVRIEGLAPLRMVEHFTVSDGKIVRVRQIHDTATLQKSRFKQSGAHDASGYRAEVEIDAFGTKVFEALTTLNGIAKWWTPQVEGVATADGRIDLAFAGLDERITMQVVSTVPYSSVSWRCVQHTGHREWVNTSIHFTIAERDSTRARLSVHHAGLVPQLECYAQCEAGSGSLSPQHQELRRARSGDAVWISGAREPPNELTANVPMPCAFAYLLTTLRSTECSQYFKYLLHPPQSVVQDHLDERGGLSHSGEPGSTLPSSSGVGQCRAKSDHHVLRSTHPWGSRPDLRSGPGRIW